MIKKLKFYSIKTRICIRCNLYFYPNPKGQKKCAYCAGLPLKTLDRIGQKCKILDCEFKVGKYGAHGYCKKHYGQLIEWPRRKIKLYEKRGGFKVCEGFNKCEIIFKDIVAGGKQRKYCKGCRKIYKNQ